jgi:hypothetical protein
MALVIDNITYDMLAALYAPRHWTFKVQTVNGDANYMYMYSYHLGIGSLIIKSKSLSFYP